MTENQRRVVILSGRHRPHEMVLLLFSAMIGFADTLGAPPPQSVAAVMPGWYVKVWAVGLLVSGVVGLLGILLPLRPDRGLWVEFGAMLIGGGALIITTASIVQYAGLAKGAFGAGFCAAWALANLWRAGQIWRNLREIR